MKICKSDWVSILLINMDIISTYSDKMLKWKEKFKKEKILNVDIPLYFLNSEYGKDCLNDLFGSKIELVDGNNISFTCYEENNIDDTLNKLPDNPVFRHHKITKLSNGKVLSVYL